MSRLRINARRGRLEQLDGVAGGVVYQDLTRIDKSVTDGDFFEKPALVGFGFDDEALCHGA